jgi:hypothetical protein
MATFVEVIDHLKATADSLPNINTVFFGNSEDVDIKRMSNYPLLHIVPENASLSGSATRLSFNIHLMDIVDFNTEDIQDMNEPFKGTDNLQYVLSECLQQLSMFADLLRRGPDRHNYLLETEPTLTPFLDSYENKLAGWSTMLTITIKGSPTTDGIC